MTNGLSKRQLLYVVRFSSAVRDIANLRIWKTKKGKFLIRYRKTARIKRSKRELETKLNAIRYATGPIAHLIGPIGLRSLKAIVRSKVTFI
jgi:hypothetical protein